MKLNFLFVLGSMFFLLACTKKPLPRESAAESSFGVYPNPVIDIASIYVNFPGKNLELLVFNSQGKELFSETVTNAQQYLTFSLNLENEPIGNYFAILKFNDKEYTVTFVKINE